MEERYIAAVDLGSSKIALTVAKIEGDDVQIIYFNTTPSQGIRYSYVFNPQKVSEPLKRLVDDAESQLGIKILQVVVGLPRYYVRQEKATGQIPRTDANSCITREEIDNLKNMALDNYPLQDDTRDIIYGAVAQSFNVGESYMMMEEDVEGMVSENIEGDFRVFIGSRLYVSNIDKVFNQLGIAIADKYFTPDVQAGMVLTSVEKDNGVALIDLGGGVTSVTIYQRGIMRHYASIPFGGVTVTNDIKMECGFSYPLAENVKLGFGACMPDKLASMSEKVIMVSYPETGAERQLPVRYLSEIITAREKEIIDAMLYEIQMSGFADELRSGVVITGGGAEMTNLANYIKDISGYDVKVGYPLHKFSASGCTGVYEADATSVIGMVLAAKGDRGINCLDSVPMPSVEEEAPEEDKEPDLEGSVFDPAAAVDPAAVKAAKAKTKQRPAKKKQTSGFWKVFSDAKDKVNSTITGLYDEIN